MKKKYGYVVNSLVYDTNNISIGPILEFYEIGSLYKGQVLEIHSPLSCISILSLTITIIGIALSNAV
jgi:hypothetical protein